MCVYLERHAEVRTVKMSKLEWECYIFSGLQFNRAARNTQHFVLPDLKAQTCNNRITNHMHEA